MAAVEMKIDDFFQKCHSRMESGYMIAALTDAYIVDEWPSDYEPSIRNNDGQKVLEIRIFNNNIEMKLVRSDISKPFLCRCIDDSPKTTAKSYDMHYIDFYDDVQILDIDETKGKSGDGYVTATGGGRYFLPLEKMEGAAIRIRYYLDRYPETGQAIVADWRAVSFFNTEREEPENG